jgi:hypothetical protein
MALPDLPPGPVTSAFRASLERALADVIPKDKRGAVLAVADDKGARIAFATRVGNHWELGASAGRSWDGDVSGAVVVQGTW